MKESMFNFVFKKPSSLETKKKEKKKELPYWDKMQKDFSSYIYKKYFKVSQRLEYVKPLSILERQNPEITRNQEENKFSRDISKEEVYKKALQVARQFGWQENGNNRQDELSSRFIVNKSGVIIDKNKIEENNFKENINEEKKENTNNSEDGIPMFITNKLRRDLKSFGVSDEEIDKMKPKEAWETLKQKSLERDLKEPNKEKIITLDELSEDLFILQKIWDEAYEKLDNVSDTKRTTELLDLTASSIDDSKSLEEYLEKNLDLKPEEKFFIEMSIQIKKFKHKAEELLDVKY